MVLRLYFLQDGGITMSELSTALFDATSVQAYPNAIGTFLHKLCKTYTKRIKKSLIATDRRFAKVRRQCEDWFTHRILAVSKHPERAVFTD